MSRPYYMVIAGKSEERSNILNSLKDRLCRTGLCLDVAPLHVPSSLKFGAFDDLIRLADQSSVYDTKVAEVFKSIDRVGKDISGTSEISVNLGANQKVSHEMYISQFEWDDTKYPRTRPVKDNVDVLVSGALKNGDEVRSKSYAFSEIKNLIQKLSPKTSMGHMQSELIDVLTPEVVSEDDFIETEHLTSIVVVVPSSREKDFLAKYAYAAEFVVPESAQKFRVPQDRDGNILYRVILFKTVIDEFASKVKAQCGAIYRKFSYSEEAYERLSRQRAQIEAQRGSEESSLLQLCKSSLADVWVSWVHLKGFRCFCESTLRFGVNSEWESFVLKLPANFNENKVRDTLDHIYGIGKDEKNDEHAIPREFAGDLGGADNYMTLPIFG